RAPPSGSRWVRPRSAGMPSIVRPPAPASAPDLAHRPLGPDEVDLADRVAGPLPPDLGLDGRGQVVVAATAPQHRPQIGLSDSEETATELALRRQPHPVAIPAERLRDAGDAADGPGAVAVPVGGGGGGPPDRRLEGEHPVDRSHDLGGRADAIGAPLAR